MRTRLFLFLVLLVCQSSWGQKPEYDFYPEFRSVVAPKFYLAHPASSLKDVVTAYVADLKAQGIDSREIERREQLILARKQACVLAKKLRDKYLNIPQLIRKRSKEKQSRTTLQPIVEKRAAQPHTE